MDYMLIENYEFVAVIYINFDILKSKILSYNKYFICGGYTLNKLVFETDNRIKSEKITYFEKLKYFKEIPTNFYKPLRKL